MFSKAVPVAAGYTRPVVISSRNAEGECGSVIGAYIVVNRVQPLGMVGSGRHGVGRSEDPAFRGPCPVPP